MNDLAVLMTCFNRKSFTIRCLDNLFEIYKNIDVFLVDDGSSDGTSDAIKNKYPQVNLINGCGDLFWNRGMHLAWGYAGENNYKYYLWLNDDVVIKENCILELLECSRLSDNRAIISGIIDSHDHEEILYGGTDERKNILFPTGDMQSITNMNGNVVLVPRAVFSILGNLDSVFHHDLGDVDYGLRAKLKSVPVLTTRVVVGSCDKNDLCRVRLKNSNLKGRFKKLYSPLGSNPNINFFFRKRHFGAINAAAYYFYVHLVNLLPDYFVKKIFGSRYF